MCQKKFYFGTNLKMYKTNRETVDYLNQLQVLTSDVQDQLQSLFVIPSYTALSDAVHCGTTIKLGAQNMHWADQGKFTGEISPLMLKEIGISIIELGHSERRHVMMESNEDISKKMAATVAHGFIGLLCVGETLRQKDDGCTKEIISIQLKTALRPDFLPEQVWVAYEPVWAIGEEGQAASAEYANEIHSHIKEILRQIYPTTWETIPVLYGGSVNQENCESLACQPMIDGLFVGRSAWQAEAFNKLIRKTLKTL